MTSTSCGSDSTTFVSEVLRVGAAALLGHLKAEQIRVAAERPVLSKNGVVESSAVRLRSIVCSANSINRRHEAVVGVVPQFNRTWTGGKLPAQPASRNSVTSDAKASGYWNGNPCAASG